LQEDYLKPKRRKTERGEEQTFGIHKTGLEWSNEEEYD
jgi:hypothetical protein